MENLVPSAPETPAVIRESRLVLRVLTVWRLASAEDELPRAGALSAADMAEDADHIFTIDVPHKGSARFREIGMAVRVSGWPSGETALVADCPDDSVLGLVTRHWREIVERRVPVTRGGTGINDGEPVLYRGVLMPLVDASGRISVIMGAANWRAVQESHGAAGN